MKKSLNINLGGIIFHIDEDAYERLYQYLSGLERKFGKNTESKEIISDIEARMAELLQERISRNKQSVDLADVEYVIAVMGGPDEVAQEVEFTPTDATTKKWYQRKLYRDPEHAVIGGVCSGLGVFLGIDPVILRILFLVLLFFGGSSIILYLILWIALPAARTPVQKLEMRGEDVNVSNIEKATRTFSQELPKGKWQAFFDTIGRIAVGLFKASVKVMAVILGLFLVLLGAAMVLFFIILNGGIFEGFHPSDFNLSLPMLFHYAVVQGQWLFQIANFLVFILPILALIYLGVKLLFNLRVNDRFVWVSALIFWLLGIVLWIVLAIFSMKGIRSESIVEEKLQFNALPRRTMVIDAKDEWVSGKHYKHELKLNDRILYYINHKNEIIGKTELIIERAEGNNIEVLLKKMARGKDDQDANSWAQKLSLTVTQQDSIIYLPSYFILANRNDWHVQQLKVVVKIPVGQTIFLSSRLKDMLVDADLNETRWIRELPGNTWIMTHNGLQMVSQQP